MFCKQCGTELQDDDVFCTHCGSKIEGASGTVGSNDQAVLQQNTPVSYQTAARQPAGPPAYSYAPVVYGTPPAKAKQTGLVIALSAVGVLLLAVIIFLAIRFLGRDKNNNELADVTRQRETTESITEKLPLGLGEAGLINGLAIMINQVTRPEADHLFSQPAEGFEHVLIWYTFENRSDKTVTTPRKTSMYLVSGQNADSDSGYDMASCDTESIYTTNDGEYQSGSELAPGEQTSGWLLYQKPIQNPIITIHIYSEFVNRAPDLVFQFPAQLEPITEPTETSESTQATEQTTTGATSAPPVLYDLNTLLPGQWAAAPDSESNALVYAFTEAGLVGSAYAYSEAETTLDSWMNEDVWTLDPYYWESWHVTDNQLVFTDIYGELSMTVSVENEDIIYLIPENSSVLYTFYRMGQQPDLSHYLIGTWIPDIPEDEGVYAALTFADDGVAILTGATKKDETAMASDWGDDELWEVLGTREGIWYLDGSHVIINIEGTDDVYSVELDGPYHCIIYYGDDWQAAYTRVVYFY